MIIKGAAATAIALTAATTIARTIRNRAKLAAHPGHRIFKLINDQDDTLPTVERNISDGVIIGFQASDDHRLHFRGIPYAQPLVGRAALLPPEKPTPWSSPLDCRNFGEACPQENPSSSILSIFGVPSNLSLNYGDVGENCLNLNVSTPTTTTTTTTTTESAPPPLPVIVWIHGGANKQGSNAECGLLLDSHAFGGESVVTVSVNYRLGLLGFGHLTANEHSETQNLALKDLHLALAWVQTNIEAFGGDSNNVTLLGESSGAVNIAALLASPYAPRTLFHRAVLSSGGPNDVPLATYDNIIKPGLFTMNVDGITADASQSVLSQSAGEPTPLLLEGLDEGETGGVGMTMADYQTTQSRDYMLEKHGVGMSPPLWCHVSGSGGDFDVLPHPILDAVKFQSARDVPLLIGRNSNEWPGFLRVLLRSKGVPGTMADAAVDEIFRRGGVGALSLNAMLRHALGNDVVTEDVVLEEKLNALRSFLRAKYSEDDDVVTKRLINMLAAAPSDMLAVAQAATGADVYAYEIDLDDEDSPLGGNFHGLDLILLFGRKMYYEEKEWRLLCEHFVGEEDLSENMVAAGDAWRAAVVRFATTGDPGVENGWGKKLGRDGQGERTIIGSGGKLRAEEFSTIL